MLIPQVRPKCCVQLPHIDSAYKNAAHFMIDFGREGEEWRERMMGLKVRRGRYINDKRERQRNPKGKKRESWGKRRGVGGVTKVHSIPG